MKNKRLLSSLLLMLFLFTPANAALAESVSPSEAGAYLKNVMRFILQEYKPGTTEEQLIEGALNGMFNNLDIYTTLYSPTEAEDFFSDLEGDYSGLGLVISKIGSFIYVNRVIPGSPAAQAGILADDRIVSIDGTAVADLDLAAASALIKGEEATMATLAVFRAPEKVLTFTAERAPIHISPFTYEINDGVAYIRMSSFTMNAGDCFRKILAELDAQSIGKIILDLRDNPGGELTAAVEMAQELVPRGPIVKIDFQAPEREDLEYFSELEQIKYRLAVLVNGSSASASEILAGAVADTNAGMIIGTQTYGKSKVQSIIPLLTPEAYLKYKERLSLEVVNGFDLINDYGIEPADEEIIGWTKITTGEYFTPNGRSLDRIGLAPDYIVQGYQPVNGIDIRGIAAFTRTAKPSLGDESPDVESAEKILRLLGYELEYPDLLFDENSFAALKQFQSDHQLYPYGGLDYITQKTLRGELEKIIREIDAPYNKALEMLQLKSTYPMRDHN